MDYRIPEIWLTAVQIWLILGVVLAIIPAAIASGKNRDFFYWWLLGLLLWPVALLAALLVEENRTKECPDCAEFSRDEAYKCRFCGHVFDGTIDLRESVIPRTSDEKQFTDMSLNELDQSIQAKVRSLITVASFTRNEQMKTVVYELDGAVRELSDRAKDNLREATRFNGGIGSDA